MDATLWVLLRSWHLVWRTGRTRCGRTFLVPSPTSSDLPTGKSCETCLRLLARDQEDGQ